MLQLLLLEAALAYSRSSDPFALLVQILLFLWAFNRKPFNSYCIKEIFNLSLGKAVAQALAGATLVAPVDELLGGRSVRRDIQAELLPVKGQTDVTSFGHFVAYLITTPAGAVALTGFHEV